MSLIKPPKLKHLIEQYGLEEAIKNLANLGLNPLEISKKYNLPYHIVKLTLEGWKPKTTTPFKNITELYDKLTMLRSHKGKTITLTKFISQNPLPFEQKIRFILGKIYDEPAHIGPATIAKAIALTAITPTEKVHQLYIDYGDYGDVAQILLEKRKTKQKLLAEEVYQTIKTLPQEKFKVELITSLLDKATANEAKYIVRLTLQQLNIKVREPDIIKAVANALKINEKQLENACSIKGILQGLLLTQKGPQAIQKITLSPGTFIPPQLAHLYEPDKTFLPAITEIKYDGSRLQIHKWGEKIWLYSRRAIEKSQTLPEIVKIARKFKAQTAIIDSEVIAIDQKGNMLPFQELLHRTTKTKTPKDTQINLTIKCFDILYLNGINLTKKPLKERRQLLAQVIPEEYLAEGKICQTETEIFQYFEEALKKGYEGIMIKNPESQYKPGERTYTWLKLKPQRDLIDCTIIKALYGKGRRAGLYSSYLLAVRHPKTKKLYTIGKVSNIPENLMAQLKQTIEQNIIKKDEEGVYIKPTIILEVTYQEIEKTDRYSSGYALRVPKIVRIRQDKPIEEIDTIEKIQKLYQLQHQRYPIKEI